MRNSPIARGALILGCLILAGCGGGPELAEVEGVVRLNGTPLPEVAVAFLPDVAAGTPGQAVRAVTDNQGRYRLPYDPGDGIGAPVGVHRVLVDDAKAKAEHSGKSRVPPQYEALLGNPLGTREIKSGKQSIDIDLTTR